MSAAEDNFSIPVMASVSGWFNCQRKNDLHEAVRQVIKLCRTPNWFAFEEGRRYVRQWLEAECDPISAGASSARLLGLLETAVRENDALRVMRAFNAFYGDRTSDRRALAQMAHRLACERGNGDAMLLAELYEANLMTLWSDGNLAGQLLYALVLGRQIGVQIDPPISDEYARTLTSQSAYSLSLGVHVPDWARDGVHCEGQDRRFSGVLVDMNRACTAFEKFGRLDPDDDFSDLS